MGVLESVCMDDPIPIGLIFVYHELMSSNEDHKAYLSILGWPSGFTHEDRAEALATAAGIEYEKAALEAKADPPTVVGMVDSIISDEILRALHDLGVLAVAIDEDAMLQFPEPEPVKRVVRFPDTHPTSFATDDNDEPAWTFTTDDIRLVVFGTARYIETNVDVERRSLGHYRFGSAASNMASQLTSGVRKTTTERTRTREMMDIHLVMDGKPRLLRLKGQRTLIRSLEDSDERPSLLAPPDPIELLEPYLDGTRIDRGFESFTPPARIRMKSGSGMLSAKKRTPEAFGFYSVWLALVEQTMRGDL
jgi:hypothetical protein